MGSNSFAISFPILFQWCREDEFAASSPRFVAGRSRYCCHGGSGSGELKTQECSNYEQSCPAGLLASKGVPRPGKSQRSLGAWGQGAGECLLSFLNKG